MLHFQIFALLLPQIMLISVGSEAKKSQHCRYIYDNSFDHCSLHTHQSNFTNLLSNFNSSSEDESERASCPREGVCSKVFNMTRMQGQTFSDKALGKISEMLLHCCGQCVRYFVSDLNTELPHLDLSDIELSDIVFPVLGRASLRELYDFHYIPTYELPSAYYFTQEITEKEMAYTIIMGCLSMWPLLVICVLWAVVAGFFIWIFETWHNPEEFPRPFLTGLFEGFWWSFISMTTVGYGDKIPKRFLGRMFSVIWILIGITITSMYIGALAGTIYSLQSSPEKPTLNGRIVGGLKHQLQDATVVAQNGGILRDIDVEDNIIGVVELIKQLDKGLIEGFVLNKVTYQEYFQAINENGKYKELAKTVEDVHLVRTELDYKGEKVVTGMLVKSEADYEFFKRYFDNNWLQIQECNSFNLNSKDKAIEYDEPSHFEGLFYPFFYMTMITMGVILGFGCVYEVYRRKYHHLHITDEVELCGRQYGKGATMA